MRRSPLLFALLAAVLFSTGGVGIKQATLTGLELSSARSLVAFVVLLTWTQLIRRGEAEAHGRGLGFNRTTLLAAVAYAATLLFFVQATKWTTAANAIFLQYTAPLYMLVFEPWMYKEKYRGRDFVVVVACLAGMSLFFVGELRADDVRGNIAALASGVSFALFSLLLRRNLTEQNGTDGDLSAVIYGNLLLGVMCAPWLVARIMSDGLVVSDVFIVLYLGTIQIGLAYTFYAAALARGARSLDVGIVGYTEAVLNPLLVLIVVGERPTLFAILGGACIVTAVIAHALYNSHRNSRRTAELSPD
ncbi:MAG: DMT family transporter [Pyrinomonadaceae bacterium MAG19_C2-C3]|nr:DMT family transporter [Pyrinomonadaceae bacterium MAG19_C2-C3]